MDTQSFDYWLQQGNYMPPHQTTIFELPPDLSKVPSLSGSPVSSTFDQYPAAIHQGYYPHIPEDMGFQPYQLPMTPSDFGSADESPYCSPRPPQPDPIYGAQPAPSHGSNERTHTTSGRRRAQNRAAQRAFRERKEKHARGLEVQLAALSEKYRTLETSHTELNAAYDKLRKTIGLLTKDDTEEDSTRRSSNADTLRKLLDILHGEVRGVKAESN